MGETYERQKEDVLTILSNLSKLAEQSAQAKALLVTPTRSEDLQSNTSSGFPHNTPLMLMVKAGHFEAVQLLLQFYSAHNLMSCTPRGNIVFHITAISGQTQVLELLTNRAKELGIEESYQSHKNQKNHTFNDLWIKLNYPQPSTSFMRFVDFTNDQLGGEEINKAAISYSADYVHQFRDKKVARELSWSSKKQTQRLSSEDSSSSIAPSR